MIKKYLQKIFKKVSYSFFLKIHGTIDTSIRSNDDNRIEVKIINAESEISYKVYKISNGRLYTDRIHDAAAILDNKIIEGPSFQLRDGPKSTIQYSKVSDSIVFRKGTPRWLRNLNGTVLSLLTGGAGNNNYWHWLYDVLPKIDLCSKFVNLNEVDFFLLPSLKRKFQKETLDCLNIPEHKRISSEQYRHIRAKELIITDHPVITTGNATKDIQNIPNWISLWLKEKFLNAENPIDKKNKVYIDRNDETSHDQPERSISNEVEIKKYLLKKNFVIVKLHNIHFTEQVNLFHNAECVVGLHGGGFANIAFCKPGTKIIELKSFGAGDVIKNLAQKNKLNYNSIEVETKDKHKFDFPHQQGSIYIPLSRLTQILES